MTKNDLKAYMKYESSNSRDIVLYKVYYYVYKSVNYMDHKSTATW